MTNCPTDPTYTARTRDWLDATFSTPRPEGGYVAHEPVFGFGSRDSAPRQAARIARVTRVLEILRKEPFEDLLDVGAAEGYTAGLVRELFGARVAACDLSREVCLRGRELFGVPTFACNAAALPLADQSFDCVLCSEVLEHLEDPFAVVSELVRVTRGVLVLTTSECAHQEWERRLHLKLRDFEKPHLEINWWMPRDFTGLLGAGVELHRQFRFEECPSDRETDLVKVKEWLRRAIAPKGLDRQGDGIVALWRRSPTGSPRSRAPFDREALWDRMLRGLPLGRRVRPEEETWAMERLRCPRCLGPLDFGLRTADCGLKNAECEGPAFGSGAKRNGASIGESDLRCLSCGSIWARYGGLPASVSSSASGALEDRRDACPTVPDLTCLDGTDRGREPRGVDGAAVRRLRRLFDPTDVWRGGRALLGGALLAGVEFWGDLRRGKRARPSLRKLRAALARVKRDLDPRAEGRLVRVRGTAPIYRIEAGRRRHIASDWVFLDLGYDYDSVRVVDPQWIERFPEGDPIDTVQ